jgi:site-specific recombinase XerD
MGYKLNRVAGVLGFQRAEDVPWSALRFQHLAAVRAKLLDDERLAPASVNTVLAALKGVARAAFRLGQIDAEDYQRIRDVDRVRGSTEPCGRDLSTSEVNRLLKSCVSDGTAGARDAAVIALMWATGMRRSEVAGLDLADYDEETGGFLVRGKGRKERRVWISGGAAEYIGDWLRVRGSEAGALFWPVDRIGRMGRRRMTDQAVYNLLTKRGRLARIERFSPHDLRRTFVGNLLEAGADISTVRQLVGHADIQTTARYDRRGDEAKRRAAGLLRLQHFGGVGVEPVEEVAPCASA